MIKIEKNVPMPSAFKYESVLAKMLPGDSFLIGSLSVAERGALYREMKRANGTYTTRTVDNGIRVWRLT